MIALIQRVTNAQVAVDNQIIGEIGQGILTLVGVEQEDNQQKADRLLQRLLGYRIFSDHEDKMNLSVKNVNGGILLVPQFTLAANTKKGMRPSFTHAAPPGLGQQMFDYFVAEAHKKHDKTETGKFGADMQVSLCNDGPVTFWLQV